MEQPETFCLKLPARFRYLQLVGESIDLLFGEWKEQLGQEQLIYGIKLAVHEIANNVIEHAYGHEEGIIEVILLFDSHTHCFTAEVSDQGAAFDPSQVITPNLEEPQESGYGLFLAKQLMDEVTYTRRPDGNQWRLVKRLA